MKLLWGMIHLMVCPVFLEEAGTRIRVTAELVGLGASASLREQPPGCEMILCAEDPESCAEGGPELLLDRQVKLWWHIAPGSREDAGACGARHRQHQAQEKTPGCTVQKKEPSSLAALTAKAKAALLAWQAQRQLPWSVVGEG